MKPRKPRYSFLMVVFLLCLFVRFSSLLIYCQFGYDAHTKSDMGFYHRWAERIAEGAEVPAQAFFGLPGYAFMVGGIYGGVGTKPTVLAVLQCLLDSLTAVLIFAISRIVVGGRVGLWVGSLAVLGWVIFPPARAYSLVLMPTSWLMAAFWLLVYTVLPAEGRRPWKAGWGLIVGLFVGLVGTMVATIFLLIPLVISAFWMRRTSVRGFLLSVFLLFAGVGSGMAPVWYHNIVVAKEPVLLSAHGGINFYVGNNSQANGYPRVPEGMRASQAEMQQDAQSIAEGAAGKPLKAWEASQFWKNKGKEFIRTEPLAWVRLMGVKFHNFWRAWSYDDLGIVEIFTLDGVISPGPGFGTLAAWGVPGLILLGTRRRMAWWILGAVGLHLLALMPVFITERYRMAAVPGLLIGASWLLVFVYQSLRKNRWALAGRSLVLVGAMSWFVSCTPREAGLFAVQEYTSGIWALDRGDTDSAQHHLERAWRYVPGNSETNFALGNLWFMKKDSGRAAIFYRKTLELSPRHDGAWNNLGVIGLESERFDEAARCFEAAIAVKRDRPRSWFLLAKSREALGQRDEAVSALENAVQRDLKREEYRQLLKEWTGP